MDKNGYKNHIENIITKPMKVSEQKTLPKAENASFKVYNETWASTIAVDIVGFKELMAHYKRFAIINIIQAFSSSVIKIGKENPYFVSAYANGDEIILNFSSDKKHKITSVYNTAVHVNSLVNYLFKDVLKENNYTKWNGAGIGLWSSDGNSLVKYGEKGSGEESFSTLVGDSIVYATYLAKESNRPPKNYHYGNKKKQIIMNKLTFINIEDSEESIKKGWIKREYVTNVTHEETYGCSVRLNAYAGDE